MTAGGGVLVEHPAAGVTRLVIDAAARRNALSAPILAGLAEAFEAAVDGCLVVTGAGDVFSAGYDLRALGDPVDPEVADATIAPDAVPAFDALRRCRVPVIAALNGPAIGGGLELALACDVRIGVPAGYLAAPAGRLGLAYSEGGLRRVLAGLPAGVAAELFVLGRHIEAERALALGVLAAVVSADWLEDAALDAAAEVLAQGPGAVGANARALRELRAAAPPPAPDIRAELASTRHAAMRSAEFAEGIAAFRGRRDPRWRCAIPPRAARPGSRRRARRRRPGPPSPPGRRAGPRRRPP
jgi:enoyl-CoA hydratase/carnithine racemase